MTREYSSAKNVFDLLCFFWKSSTTCLLPFFYRSSFEGFFASKGAAYALPDGDFARRATKHGGKGSKGLHYANEVFFDRL